MEERHPDEVTNGPDLARLEELIIGAKFVVAAAKHKLLELENLREALKQPQIREVLYPGHKPNTAPPAELAPDSEDDKKNGEEGDDGFEPLLSKTESRVWNIICKEPGVTTTEIYRRFGNHGYGEISEALTRLERDQVITARRYATGGRDSVRWFPAQQEEEVEAESSDEEEAETAPIPAGFTREEQELLILRGITERKTVEMLQYIVAHPGATKREMQTRFQVDRVNTALGRFTQRCNYQGYPRKDYIIEDKSTGSSIYSGTPRLAEILQKLETT